MKIAICDDEPYYRQTILDYLIPFKTEENSITAAEFQNGEDLISAFKNGENFDIVFLDIEMKGITGIETGEQIREIDKNVITIFITSHQEYVPDAFRLNAFQFLTKPVKSDEFNKEFTRALKSAKQCKEKYIIKTMTDTQVIYIQDIVYIEVFNHDIAIHTEKNIYKKHGKLKDEFEKLKGYNFIKCHKSILVNMDYIRIIGEKSIILSSNDTIALSRNYRAQVLNRFNFYLAGCSI